MNPHPFQFWSDFFSYSARALDQMEDTRRTTFRGLSDLQEMFLLSRRIWGLDTVRGNRSTDADPQDSYPFLFPIKGFLYSWGLVSLQDHLSLVRKYEKLKEKVAADEETIRHLRLLLKESSREDTRSDFQDLFKKQCEAFSEFMRSLHSLPEK